MPNIKILDPWKCICCHKKFPKNEGYEKLQNLDFSNPKIRKQIINTRNNETDYYKRHKLWFDHLLCMPGNPLFDGRCPKSLCVFCATYEKGGLFDFNCRSSFSYHQKKCPHKGKNLKTFVNQYKFYTKEWNDLDFKEKEKEEQEEKIKLAKQKYEKNKKEEEEERIRKEEDFKSRAAFYDAPPPRSQASIDREKKYKKCAKEKEIDILMG